MKIGQITSHGLKKWLQGHNALRLRLWKSCILISLSHGLCCAGLRKEGLHQLLHRIGADIRRFAKSPAHITHETTVQLCQRLQISVPLSLVQDAWISTFGRLRSTRDGLDQSGFLRNINLDRIQRAMSVFEPLPKTSTDDQDFFACPYCDINPLMYIDACRNGTKHISCTNVSSHSEMRKEVDQNVPTAPNALPPGRPCDSHSTRSLFSILSQT